MRKLLFVISILIMFTGCSGCFRTTAMHLVNADESTKVLAKEQYPERYGSIVEVVEKYRSDNLEYGIWFEGHISKQSINRLLDCGYNVVAVIPSDGNTYHAFIVKSLRDIENYRILEIHYSKERS